MMTRSIVGRFLILAVLLVSLGVIAQAALIITRGPGKAVAKANAAPLAAAPASAVASAASAARFSAAFAARFSAAFTTRLLSFLGLSFRLGPVVAGSTVLREPLPMVFRGYRGQGKALGGGRRTGAAERLQVQLSSSSNKTYLTGLLHTLLWVITNK